MANLTTNSFEAIRVKENERHYIFNLSIGVTREHVYYFNRYGIELAADLYYASDLDKAKLSPVIVIGPPFGGVKEQGPGVYANELARRGFVVLAFDPAYHGYSGGQPRYVGSPDTYLEDFSAAVDFLGALTFVNRDQIGAIGICASGGFALGAAAQDPRIKAVVTSVLYDIPSLAGSAQGQDRLDQLTSYALGRWSENGGADVTNMYPEQPVEEVPADIPMLPEFFDFYGTKRGWHPHARTNITGNSNPSFINFQATNHIATISPRPVLMLTSEEAHSKSFTDDIFERLGDAKERYVAPQGLHVDFYDNKGGVIPFDRIVEFFKNHLK